MRVNCTYFQLLPFKRTRLQMKNIDFKTQILPHLVAIVVFLLIVFVYFNPLFMDNKTVKQNDILQWKGGAHELLEYREKTGEEGLWTDAMFGGMPGYLVSTVFKGDLVQYIKKCTSLGLPRPASQSFIAMLCFYVLLLVFGVRPYLAIVGAIAFGLNSFNIINMEAGHNTKGWAIAYMSLVIAGVHLTLKKGKLLTGFTLTAVALALNFRVNHPQITYYLLFILLIYGLAILIDAVKEKQLVELSKRGAILILAAGLAIGTNFGRYWTVMEYSAYSQRGKSELKSTGEHASDGLDRNYAFDWSNGMMETMTLLIPNYYGGASNQSLDKKSNLGKALKKQGAAPQQIKQQLKSVPTYWGPMPFTSGAIYAGALVCFLFVLGLFLVEKKYRYWLLAATILSIMLSWGKNFETFNYLMFDYFPMYNKFRAVSMTIVIALVTMPLLGFMALEKVFQMGFSKTLQKQILIAFGVTGGMALLTIALAGMGSFTGAVDAQLTSYPAWFLDALKADRESMMRSDAFRSLAFILLGVLAIYFYLKEKISQPIAIAIIGVLVLVDLWVVDKRYLNDENYAKNPEGDFFAPNAADNFIKQDKALSYRVFNLQNPWNEARTSYHHKSVGGYHAAKIRRYQDLISAGLTTQTNTLVKNLQAGKADFTQAGLLNMLNTKYITFSPEAAGVIKNPNALGNAWFVGKVKLVNSPDEELENVETINTSTTAVVDVSKFKVAQQYGTSGAVKLLDYKPNFLKYESNNTEKGMAVFSEIYYPVGWTATIDGKKANILRANYVLRALEIPAGKHTIEFMFAPKSYEMGNSIMLASSVILYLVLIASLVVGFIRKKE